MFRKATFWTEKQCFEQKAMFWTEKIDFGQKSYALDSKCIFWTEKECFGQKRKFLFRNARASFASSNTRHKRQ